jgi:L-asparagine transporter-like permease
VTATVRVTFALARDGLTFRRLGYMSEKQAPTFTLIIAGALIMVFTLWDFTEVLGIYFLAATVLYGLSYASLIVFRLREAEFPAHVFRCPFGYVMAVTAILVQLAVAIHIVVNDPRNSLYTIGLLVFLGLLYLVWPKRLAS